MKIPAGLVLLVSAAAAAAGAIEGAAAGVEWLAPAAWKSQPARSMRVATYEIPAASGSEAGECGVFYFGEGKGGGVEDNIARWIGQFEAVAPPKRETRTVHDLRVYTVDVSGTYLASGGPMMQAQAKKPGYRLFGAIVEAPRGLVFFKCTGPAATIAKAQADLQGLIGSLAKSAASRL
jgi:hypothetical protein